MYQYLTGKLIEKSATSAVVDVHGIGYLIHIPVSTFSALPALGENIKLLTFFVVREDLQALYGFSTEEERQLFKLLISVSGIGPKMAMTALSGIPLTELKRAIVDGDLAVLTSISGIGRKTAERIVVELREKLVLEERRVPVPAGAGNRGASSLIEDSLQALVELGYRKQNARDAIEKALKKEPSDKFTVSDLIRVSLKYV